LELLQNIFQTCPVYRLKQSEIPNIEKSIKVFGRDKVTYNNSRLEKVGEYPIPIIFDDPTTAFFSRQVELEIYLPDPVLMQSDVIVFQYLNSKVELVVQQEIKTQIEFLYQYKLVSRASTNHKGEGIFPDAEGGREGPFIPIEPEPPNIPPDPGPDIDNDQPEYIWNVPPVPPEREGRELEITTILEHQPTPPVPKVPWEVKNKWKLGN